MLQKKKKYLSLSTNVMINQLFYLLKEIEIMLLRIISVVSNFMENNCKNSHFDNTLLFLRFPYQILHIYL